MHNQICSWCEKDMGPCTRKDCKRNPCLSHCSQECYDREKLIEPTILNEEQSEIFRKLLGLDKEKK